MRQGEIEVDTQRGGRGAGLRKVGNRGRIQKSLRSVKMRSHIATVTPGSSVQSVNTGGEWRRVCVCLCVVKKTVC